MFPEMAFSGYCFKSPEHIKPCLEIAGLGPTFKFLQTLAKRLDSYVYGGYPEVFMDKKSEKVLYNSSYLIGRSGKLIENYRKHHLFETDHRWAKEGASFTAVTLTTRDGTAFKTGLAICMDINCYEFKDET